jgi:signal transduction histidine kinase
MTILSEFCATGNFMPHGYCYLWLPNLVGLHVISDTFISLAYFAIPISLIFFIHKRSDLPFNWMFACFGVFIIACGITHVLEIVTIWRPLYWLAGMVKAITAIASVLTAVFLIKLLPKALALPGPEQLRQTNLQLEEEIKERKRTEVILAKQARELAHSNAELEQFAYAASHDLKEPLRMITSFTQLLEKRYGELLDTEGKQFMWFVVDGAKRMQYLIDDLLAFARLGRQAANFKPVACSEIIDTVLINLKVAIEESHAEVCRGILPKVTADAVLLSQVFQNLLGNAIKFKRKQTPIIQISADPQGTERWCFKVQDNGIGIEAKYYERIFGLFQRLHTKDEYEGTGIGLAICKKIIELHGGKIWVESTLGQGTTFYFTLPAVKEGVL